MSEGTTTMEPDTQTRRKVLKQKQSQHRVTGYEAAVNAKLERKFGDAESAEEWQRRSEKNYRLAREIQAMLDDLPDTEGE